MPTNLGVLTALLMIGTATGYLLRTTLDQVPVPASPDDAENLLLDILASR
jgi:hypothetical protein